MPKPKQTEALASVSKKLNKVRFVFSPPRAPTRPAAAPCPRFRFGYMLYLVKLKRIVYV